MTILTTKEFNAKLSSIKTRNSNLRGSIEELLNCAIEYMLGSEGGKDTRQIADLLNATKGEYAGHNKLLGYTKEKLPCLVQGTTKDKKIKFKVEGEASLVQIEAANHWTWKAQSNKVTKTNEEKLIALLEKMAKANEHVSPTILDAVAALIVEPTNKAA